VVAEAHRDCLEGVGVLGRHLQQRLEAVELAPDLGERPFGVARKRGPRLGEPAGELVRLAFEIRHLLLGLDGEARVPGERVALLAQARQPFGGVPVVLDLQIEVGDDRAGAEIVQAMQIGCQLLLARAQVREGRDLRAGGIVLVRQRRAARSHLGQPVVEALDLGLDAPAAGEPGSLVAGQGSLEAGDRLARGAVAHLRAGELLQPQRDVPAVTDALHIVLEHQGGAGEVVALQPQLLLQEFRPAAASAELLRDVLSGAAFEDLVAVLAQMAPDGEHLVAQREIHGQPVRVSAPRPVRLLRRDRVVLRATFGRQPIERRDQRGDQRGLAGFVRRQDQVAPLRRELDGAAQLAEAADLEAPNLHSAA